MSLLIVTLLVHSSVFVAHVVFGDDLVVQTTVGSIRGQRATDGDYNMFMGIPYAAVNSSNTFGPSIPNPTLDDVFDANDDTAICPQVSDSTFIGTLDCLHLNIYVPTSANSTNPLSVIVWIHGGNYVVGSHGRNWYGPQFLVRHDVIVVTMNYRLGPYGFMCLHAPEVPGNQGLKDQLAGLRWIKDNIEAFGGDVGKITLMGESAGSWSIHWHLLSPQEDLFNQAIFQSGTVLTTDSVINPDKRSAVRLAQDLGYVTNDTNDALSFLARADPHDVIRVTAQNDYSFGICVEKYFDGIEKLVTRHPLNSDITKANGKKFMIGYNSDEAIHVFANMHLLELGFLRDIVFNLWLSATFNLEAEQLHILDRIFKNFYTGNATPNDQLRFQLADFASDIFFVYPSERAIASFLANGAENIFYYKFSYVGERNVMRILNNVTVGGAAHADELGYLFEMDMFTETPTAEDQLVIDGITTLWTNFAKFGNPTPQLSDLLPVQWEAITNYTPYHYLDIDLSLTAGFKPFQHRTSFFDLLYNEYYQYEVTFERENSASRYSVNTCTTFLVALLVMLY